MLNDLGLQHVVNYLFWLRVFVVDWLFKHLGESKGLCFNFLLLLRDLIAGKVSDFIHIFNHAAKLSFSVFLAMNELLPVESEPSLVYIHRVSSIKESLLNFRWVHNNLAYIWFSGETRRFR
jgi:hypothetical protein